MIVRRKYWPLLIALFVLGPLAGIGVGMGVAGLFGGSCETTAPANKIVVAPMDAQPPTELVLPNGQEVAPQELAPGRPVALVVMKGAWCKVCQRQLDVLSKRLDEVQMAGGAVFGVSDAKPATNRQLMDKLDLQFPVLSDEDHDVLDLNGLTAKSRCGSMQRAIPGVIFLDANGEVERVHRGRYPGQPQEDFVVGQLEGMGK